MIRKTRAFALLLLLCVVFSGAANAVESGLAVSAKSAALMDAQSGRMLYLKDPDTRRPIASITKIMTALVVLENCQLDDVVQVADEAVGVEGSSIYLQYGDEYSVRALLYGLMLKSGNDAAVALAIHCGGSVKSFVDMMNAKAAQLGLRDTHFENPNGLDAEGHYSTAREMALLTAAALQNPDFSEIVSTEEINIEGRYFKNSNKLLQYYPGANGVKTGYTKTAGRTLVGSATRDGQRLITVTLDDPDDWADHAAMFDYGFANFTQSYEIPQFEELASLPVVSGDRDSVPIVAGEAFIYRLRPDETVDVQLYLPSFVYAPVVSGEIAGQAVITVDGEVARQIPLIYDASVDSEKGQGLIDGIKDFFFR